ncbi:MAG TPA: hypothetical protein VK587_08535 [bacterium]|nr:hypothetical protein [bacterium]
MTMQRKNLIVDALSVRELAARLKVSESEAVRRAVSAMLTRQDSAEGMRQLRERGTLMDAYRRAPKS